MRLPSRSRPTRTLLAALLGLSAAAFAEDTQPEKKVTDLSEAPAPKKAATEEIVVTGSRVRRKELTTAAPLTVVSREQIQTSGAVTLGDFLQTLPTQGNAINPQVNNGGNGTTALSLRSLGSQRTLVLVDGKRFVAGGSGANASVDINTIPTSAIERVEVSKDGASALYGSDAIGGVVNVITRKRYSGTEASAYYGQPTQGKGSEYDLSLTTGSIGERGSMMIGAGYTKIDPILAGDRGWAAVSQSYNYGTGKESPGGSPTVPNGSVNIDPSTCPTALCQLLTNAFGKGKQLFVFDPKGAAATGGFRPFADSDLYNFQAVNYLLTPSQRVSLFSNGEYHLGDSARAYVQASYVNRQSNVQLAPVPLVLRQLGVSVSKDNQYNPFGVDLPDVSRRLVELDGRKQAFDIDTFRVVAGVDGTLPEALGPLHGWFWDVSFNYGRNNGDVTLQGALNKQNIAAGLGASAGGKCTTAGATACVPVNLFGGAGSISSDQLAALGSFTGINRGFNQQSVVQANVSGDLFRLFAERPAGIAAGYEYRHELGANIPNPISQANLGTDFNGLATSGGYHVNEAYAELLVPIVDHQPGAETLELSAAARFVDYNTFGTNATYKLGLVWKPITDLTLRGTWSTGFRAPGIADLYGGNTAAFESATDPCAKVDLNDPNLAVLRQKCQAQGALNNKDIATQFNSTVGGNPKLQPEKAYTYTAGAVYEPSFSFTKGLAITADFYAIHMSDLITNISTPVIFQGCYPTNGKDPNEQYCALIHRGSDGLVLTVDDTQQNVGTLDLSGLDLSMRWAVPTGFGRFVFIVDGTLQFKYDQVNAGGQLIHGIGTYDLGVLPSYKFNPGVSYSYEGLSAALSGRVIGGFHECANSKGGSSASGLCYQPAAQSNGQPYPVHEVPAYATIDLNVAYRLPSSYGTTTLAVGARNLLDQDPPRVYDTAASTNSDTTTYDYVGRTVYFRATHQF